MQERRQQPVVEDHSSRQAHSLITMGRQRHVNSSEAGSDPTADPEEAPIFLPQHISRPCHGRAVWWARASTWTREPERLRRRGEEEPECRCGMPGEVENPAAATFQPVERSRRGGGGGGGAYQLLLVAISFGVHAAGVQGFMAGAYAAGYGRHSHAGGLGSMAFSPCIAGGGIPHSSIGPSSTRWRLAPASCRVPGGQAQIGRGVAVAMMAKRRKPVPRREDLLKERSVSEIVSDWPGGLGRMKTKSERERQAERSWEWFRLLWFRFKVKKSWVRYLKATKLLVLYLAFSSVVSAVHICAFATAVIAGLQILLEREADREIPDQDRLLSDLLVYWDEHEDDETRIL